jgi:hypothetical protein
MLPTNVQIPNAAPIVTIVPSSIVRRIIVGGVIILCLLMIMFGKKTKNIVPDEEITKNKKVVVFDFDETLTMEHTGGCDNDDNLEKELLTRSRRVVDKLIWNIMKKV